MMVLGGLGVFKEVLGGCAINETHGVISWVCCASGNGSALILQKLSRFISVFLSPSSEETFLYYIVLH